MAMPTIQEALDFLGLDYADEKVKKNVQRDLNAAIAHLKGAVGKNVVDQFPDDARAHDLVLFYTDRLYNGGAGAKSDAAVEKLITNMENQLRLELRSAEEAKAL